MKLWVIPSESSLWYIFILKARALKSSEASQNSLLVLLRVPVFSLVNILIFFLANSFSWSSFLFLFWMTLLKVYGIKLSSLFGFRLDDMFCIFPFLLISGTLGERNFVNL